MSSENKSLDGKRVIVLGASRGIGRGIVERALAGGGQVLAVARGKGDLSRLTGRGISTLALDAASESAPSMVFGNTPPDVLVICGGALPQPAWVSELNWAQFSVNWEVDTKMAFLFCREALRVPLVPGSVVVIISSGAGFSGGGPNSGGYAGAKRMQMILAKYCQAESDRRGLGIRFVALVPTNIMPETELGQVAVTCHARDLGVSPEKVLESMDRRRLSPVDVVEAVLKTAVRPPAEAGSIFKISADGLVAAN
jgi:NAD(P)-dependent dehydrogenase (short-subunit alcohol dehydrogenase family)